MANLKATTAEINRSAKETAFGGTAISAKSGNASDLNSNRAG